MNSASEKEALDKVEKACVSEIGKVAEGKKVVSECSDAVVGRGIHVSVLGGGIERGDRHGASKR